MSALMLLAACNVSKSDIPIAPDANQGGRSGSAAPRSPAPRDTGAGATSAAGREPSPPVDAGGVAGSGEGAPPVGPPVVSPDPDATTPRGNIDAGMDSGIDAARDAEPEGGTIKEADADEDADPDSGETVDPWRCESGSVACVPAKFDIYADNLRFAGDGEVEVQFGSVTLEVKIRAGVCPEVLLPVDEPLWTRTRFAGYWADQAMLEIPPDAVRLDGALFVFSSAVLSQFTAPFQVSLDESRAFAIADFFANLPAAGVDLGVPAAVPVVLASHGLAQSVTLLPHPAGNLMMIANVAPGMLDPKPISPPGYECRMAVPGLEYHLQPKTVLRMWIPCDAVPPP